MRVRFLVEATCVRCYLSQRTQLDLELVEREFFTPFPSALEVVEREFLADLVETDGWHDDGEQLLCRLCARKMGKEQEGAL